ncbi:hypothetical protein LEMLEM_LOCUS1786 [Lemmus lemmus]
MMLLVFPPSEFKVNYYKDFQAVGGNRKRKQETMNLFQVKMDQLCQGRPPELDRGYLSIKVTTAPPRTWSLSQNFIRDPKDTSPTDSRKQFEENNANILKSFERYG